jgi:hypothetical protein
MIFDVFIMITTYDHLLSAEKRAQKKRRLLKLLLHEAARVSV